MYNAPTSTQIQVLQAEIEAVAGETTGDMSRDTVDNFAVRLQRIHEDEESHIQRMFTIGPHAHRLSMEVRFHLCITSFCALQNYKYSVRGRTQKFPD